MEERQKKTVTERNGAMERERQTGRDGETEISGQTVELRGGRERDREKRERDKG